MAGTYFSLFLPVFVIFVALSSALAMRWAKVSTGRIGIVIISWGLAWFGGDTLGSYLLSIFGNSIVSAITDALSILLGLLFTLGVQTEDYGKILKTALWGALGFAAGNFVVSLPPLASLSLPAEFYFILWGLLGGAILEAPSRDWLRILFSAVLCGVGLFAGSLVAFRVLPALISETYVSTFPERFAMFQQVLYGMGLGLAISLLIRRASAVGILALLGAGMYMMTRALNMEVFHLPPIWSDSVRGALIGLVLGYGYGYMRGVKPMESNTDI